MTCKEAYDARPEDLLEYNGIIIGAYTWGDGELPDEFLDFYEDMTVWTCLASRRRHRISHLCGAVDIIENKLRELGAAIVCDGLTFEYNASDEEKEQGKRCGALLAGALCRS